MMTKEEFKVRFKRIMRQLAERQLKVSNNQRPDGYYQIKRKEFITLIDEAIESKIFTMPGPTYRVYKIYHDTW